MTTLKTTTPPNETRYVALAILGVMFGLLLSMLDGFIVGTAMPTIVGELGRADLLAWVVTAYALMTAVSTPIWGKLGDLFGRKRMYQLAITLFIIASILAALAPTMELLIATRALQGIGAGGLAVSAFAVIGDLVPPRERGKYQGMTAIIVAVGTIGGPLAGGLITDGLGWRWAFLINLPLGIIAIVWTAIFLRIPATRQRDARIDWVGALLLGGSVAGMVLLTTWAGTEFAWVSWQSAAFVLAIAAAMTAFIRWELRTPEPLVPLQVFRSRSFTMASILGFISGAVMFAAVLYLPLFQQTVQGASASESGLQLLPMMVPVVIVSLVAGIVMTRTGRYRLFPIIGSASMIVGGALLSTMTADTRWVVTGAFMVFIGIGSGLTQQMTTTIAQNSVEQRDIGAASGVVTLLRTLGGSIAVAVFGSIFTTHTAGLTGHALSVGVADSTRVIFLIVAGLSVISLAAAIAIRETPLRGRQPASTD
ncbi:DHA2 family efflux MFS transporter permease subunit [Mycetocola tolaasinivorans]|uniref:DHA2 family efflux MFS transporter permease subunit n=1 Tax=Mycetocola tolaasinivorans TaxID=76635 RepID=A0A3L7AB39_9MICO|nr:MDR family MFS transporter [Mycetocola tolaasinivorans]RLP76562.1 DHA2 family efflux MFS transporter permease subunit [Mycetocola tolaasinivorans]